MCGPDPFNTHFVRAGPPNQPTRGAECGTRVGNMVTSPGAGYRYRTGRGLRGAHVMLASTLLCLALPRQLQEAATASCGVDRDCARSYSLARINVSTARWDPFDATARRHLMERRQSARAACSLQDSNGGRLTRNGPRVTNEGGWCLSSRNTTDVQLPHNQSYLLPLHHVRADPGIVEGLLQLQSDNGRRVSFNDFGAGVGQYGHALLSRYPTVRWRGYDGAGNIDSFTSGFVEWFDLSLPLALPRSDWLISLEVGEHVPHTLEEMVVRNLHAHNCRGVILSWASLGQGGHFHVNNHGEEYLTSIFVGLGYYRNETLTSMMRTKAHRSWFKNNLMVFERHRPTACHVEE